MKTRIRFGHNRNTMKNMKNICEKMMSLGILMVNKVSHHKCFQDIENEVTKPLAT